MWTRLFSFSAPAWGRRPETPRFVGFCCSRRLLCSGRARFSEASDVFGEANQQFDACIMLTLFGIIIGLGGFLAFICLF